MLMFMGRWMALGLCGAILSILVMAATLLFLEWASDAIDNDTTWS